MSIRKLRITPAPKTKDNLSVTMQLEKRSALTPTLSLGRNDSDGNRRKQRKRRVSKAPVRVEGAHGVHHSVSVPESEKVGFMLFPHLCSLCCLLFNCMVPAQGEGETFDRCRLLFYQPALEARQSSRAMTDGIFGVPTHFSETHFVTRRYK